MNGTIVFNYGQVQLKQAGNEENFKLQSRQADGPLNTTVAVYIIFTGTKRAICFCLSTKPP
jgi:hypothetical protein